MNSEENVARKTLGMLGEINRLLREHAVVIERRTGVKSATTRLEVVDYKSGPTIEGFVDAEMENGSGLCWCLDVKWTEDSFHIEGTLYRNSSAGSETLKQLPVQVVTNVRELRQVLIAATRALLALDSA